MIEGRSLHQRTLVGRQRELDRLWNLFGQSRTSRLLVALVAGEPGIGKTRLLQEVAGRAEQVGGGVLRGGASEAQGMPPYLPFLEALGHHIRTAAPDTLRTQTRGMASILATILPELSVSLGRLATRSPLPPEQARLRLYEAVATFLAGIAAQSGLVLLLDDLHWADTSTLDLLCHVARSQPQIRLLILGAYREGEVTHRPAFERALTELNRLRLLTTLTLDPLSEADLSTLAINVLGAPLDPLLLHQLATLSEGNPFFAEEFLRDWLESGCINQPEPVNQMETTNETYLPSGIVNTLRSRIGRLDQEAVGLLQGASIIGRTFDASLLAEVAGQDVEVVEEQLRKAREARLLRLVRPGTFTFSHDLIRANLSNEVTLSRRKRVHTLIGRSLALRLHFDRSDSYQLAELAFHFAQSLDQEQGAVYSVLAAEEAMRASAAEVAVGHYRQAMQLVSSDDLRLGTWLMKLGEAALLAGLVQEAIDTYAAALDRWRRTGDRTAAGQAALGRGRAYWRLENVKEAQKAFEQAVSLLSNPPIADTVRALVELGSLLLLSLHNYSQAQRHLEQALNLARQLDEVPLEASTSRALGNLLVRAGNATEGIRLLEEALALADTVSDAGEAAECCGCLVIARHWRGQLDGQAEMLMRWQHYAQLCHDSYQLRHIHSHLAIFHALRGEWAEAEEALVQSQTLAEQQALPEPLAMQEWTHGMILAWRGDLDTALELVSFSIARFRVLSPQSLIWWLGGLGMVQAWQGNRVAALAALDELETLIAPLPVGAMPMAHALSQMAAIAARLEDLSWARRLYPRLLQFRGQFHASSIDRLLGIFATLLGDFVAARDHLAAAKTMARHFALKVELAGILEALADLAIAERRRDSKACAREQIEEAQILWTQLGNQLEARRLRDRLRWYTGRGTRSGLPASLSAREVEVLQLVAQGKSNRQIAQALSISERTVINHLSSVFNKTGVDNRAGATAFALRQGLFE